MKKSKWLPWAAGAVTVFAILQLVRADSLGRKLKNTEEELSDTREKLENVHEAMAHHCSTTRRVSHNRNTHDYYVV